MVCVIQRWFIDVRVPSGGEQAHWTPSPPVAWTSLCPSTHPHASVWLSILPSTHPHSPSLWLRAQS